VSPLEGKHGQFKDELSDEEQPEGQ